MRILTALIAATSLFLSSAFARKNLTLEDLPSGVQATVQQNLKGGDIRTISQEKEHGVTQYEIETMLNGKHRDFNVDRKGNLVVVEEETSINGIPEAARAAILKKVAGGKLGMVETLTKGGATFYEAANTTKVGKKSEVLVKPDGTETVE